MRITVEPTTKKQISGEEKAEIQYPKVIVEYPNDHMNIEAWLEMFRTVLVVMGFDREKIADRLIIEKE